MKNIKLIQLSESSSSSPPSFSFSSSNSGMGKRRIAAIPLNWANSVKCNGIEKLRIWPWHVLQCERLRWPDICILENIFTSPLASRTFSTSVTYSFRWLMSWHLKTNPKIIIDFHLTRYVQHVTMSITEKDCPKWEAFQRLVLRPLWWHDFSRKMLWPVRLEVSDKIVPMPSLPMWLLCRTVWPIRPDLVELLWVNAWIRTMHEPKWICSCSPVTTKTF